MIKQQQYMEKTVKIKLQKLRLSNMKILLNREYHLKVNGESMILWKLLETSSLPNILQKIALSGTICPGTSKPELHIKWITNVRKQMSQDTDSTILIELLEK